ncbi:hypothetical protein ACJX0J_022613 [Zea mays]
MTYQVQFINKILPFKKQNMILILAGIKLIRSNLFTDCIWIYSNKMAFQPSCAMSPTAFTKRAILGIGNNNHVNVKIDTKQHFMRWYSGPAYYSNMNKLNYRHFLLN